jgi:hypothetical protein
MLAEVSSSRGDDGVDVQVPETLYNAFDPNQQFIGPDAVDSALRDAQAFAGIERRNRLEGTNDVDGMAPGLNFGK